MADPRTFVLIGEFKDGITPELQKINNQLASLKNSFANLGGKGARNASRDMGRFSAAVSSLSQNLKEQNQALRAAVLPMREYRKEVGKTVGALMQLNAASGRRGAAAGIDATNRALREQIRLMAQVNQQSQRLNSQRSSGGGRRGGGGGGMDLGPVPYQQPPRDNQRRYQGSVARNATFAFGQTLGYQLSNTITGSIVQGFQIGVGLMVKPFQYFLDGFAERVKDESTDVQTAGAMFAIAQSKNMNMFENFNQAIRAQQQINYKLAESAAALPGATTEYVQMGKRVLDSMMTVLSKDVKGVSAFAQELDPELKAGDKQGALATLTQKFTEKAVLLGQGSTYRGNYGVPQLLEQLIGSEKVSESMFNKYAMFKDLPIFQSVFKDMQGEIAKTGAYSAERIRKVFQLLDEALPNEVLQAHKNTMSGFLEAMKSAFLDPEVGLFGLGRKIQGMEMAMVDQYGNFIDKQGKIVKSWEEAEKEQISLYESIQKILTGFGLPLSELATYLPQLFEPFAKLITPLESMFKVAQGFYRNFNIYTKEFENLAKGLSDMGDKKGAATMKKSAGARGTLLAISNLLTAFGDMSGAKFKDISTKLQDPAADIAAISKEVMTSVFNSKFVEELGFQIGMLVGGVLSTVAQLLGFAKGAGDTRIVAGLKSGFEAAGGTEAFKSIFSNLFQLIFKAIKKLFLMAPAQITAFLATALTIPALMSGISVAIGNIIEDMIDQSLNAMRERSKNIKPKNLPKLPPDLPPLPTGVDPITGKTIPALDPRAKPAPAPQPTKAGRLKNFFKGAVGADESLLGRPLIDFFKNILPGIKAAFAKLVSAFNGLTPVLSGMGTFFATMQTAFGKFLGWMRGDASLFGKQFQKLGALILDWVEGGISIRTELAALLTPFKNAFTGLKNVLFDWIEGSFSIRTEVGAALKNFGKNFQNFFAKGKGGLASLFGKGKGLLGGLLGGAKGAGDGLKGLFGKGLKGLGKFGGIATAGVGIIEAIMALLSGDSLGTALGKGAGPVLGTIIGTALLGPLGGIIGGMIGGMKPITDALGESFRALLGALEGAGSAILTFGKLLGDIIGSIAGMFGGGGDFDGLKAILAPLTLAFQALEVGVKGLALLIQQIRLEYLKRFGTSAEYQEATEERNKLAEELEIAKARADVYNDGIRGAAALEKKLNDMRAEYASLVSSGEIKRAKSGYLRTYIEAAEKALLGELKEEVKEKEDKLKTDRYLSEERKKQIQKEIDLTKQKIKDLESGKKTPSEPKDKDKPTNKPPAQPYSKPIYSTPGKPGFLTLDGKTFWRGTDGTLTAVVGGVAPKTPTTKPVGGGSPSGSPAKASLLGDLPKTSEQNAKNTTDLNKKATDQLKKAAEVKTSTDNTTQAVRDLTTKITSQTNLQTTTAAIYNLLASGTLRVQGTMAGGAGSNGLPPGTPLPLRPGQTGTEWLLERAADPTAWEAFGSPGKMAGSLASAVSYENKHKPAGSDLVVANSSETVIPAAGGYGMEGFMDTLRWGFNSMLAAFKQAQQKQDQMLSSINQTLKANQQQTNMRLLAMEKKFATPGMPGGLGGGAAGGVDAFTPIAQRMGLQMTSGYRPGDPGWHGANRARDFSNGTGPTPQMMQFAQYMASTYGSNLKELIYTPLGFSIKNGQQVPPYAQGSHYNHVHVAYAGGIGNGVAFNTLPGAEQWERSMVAGSVKVASVTSNSSEGFGNNIGSINVTVNAGNISDPDTLADVVAQRILSEMQNTDSIFV